MKSSHSVFDVLRGSPQLWVYLMWECTIIILSYMVICSALFWALKYCFKFVELLDYRDEFMKILHIQSVEMFISSTLNMALSMNVLKAYIVSWMNWVSIMRLTCIVLKGHLNKPLEWEEKWIYKLVKIQLASFFKVLK